MRRLLALLTVLALLFAACGDDGDSKDASDDPSSESTDGGDAGDDAGDDEGDDAALEAKLLTADELGTDWTEDADSGEDEDDDEGDGPECLQDPPDDADHDEAEASFTFDATGSGFPSLQEQVTDYGDVATITSSFDTAAAAIDSCGDFSYSSDGVDFTGSIEPLDFASVGDASKAWTLHLATEGYDFTAYIVYARIGSLGVSVYYIDLDDPDLAAFGEIVDLAVAKI